MLKKNWILLGILILIVLSVSFFYLNGYKSQIEGQVIKIEEIPVELTSQPEFNPPEFPKITPEELAIHNTEDDCWIVYEKKVYDFSEAKLHPNISKTLFTHCGKISGFEEAAKKRHNSSSEDRVKNYGEYIGDLN